MTNVLEYLEHSARVCPDKTALVDPNGTCTYAQLEERSRAVGSALAGYTAPGAPVVIWMEKSIPAVSAFMGCVYAGCFYVYLSPDQPKNRGERILSVAQARLVITTRELLPKWQEMGLGGEVLLYEDLAAQRSDDARLAAIRARSRDVDPLYCNFTSGSTGTPKGVVVSHRSVIDFMNFFPELFDITGEDVLGNQAPFDFEVSVKDL